jgi:hypothetical protein
MRYIKRVLLLFFFIIFIMFFPKKTFAVSFDLIAPSGTLTRGQNVDFTINIDTEGQSVSSTQIGMTYETDVLEFVSATPGETMPNLTTTPQNAGELVFSATNTSGFSGTGKFATVTFKIIATAAGNTQLCVLFAPSSPPSSPASPSTPSAYVPAPRTGNDLYGNIVASIGLLFLVSSAGFLFFYQKTKHHSR